MAKLKFTIDGQKLICMTPSVMVSGTIHYFGADFGFMTKAWEGLEKYAHFEHNGEVYDVLIENDAIDESAEEMSLEAGVWTVWAHGAEYENDRPVRRITTTSASFLVEQSGDLNGEMFPSVLPSVGEQIVARATEQAEKAEDAAEDAANAADNAMRLAGIARTHAVSADTSATNARISEQNAEGYAHDAREYRNEADTFADSAEASMFVAQSHAEAAKQAAEEAKHSKYDDTEIRGEIDSLSDGLAKKMTAPATGLEVGKYFRVVGIDDDWKPVLEYCDLPVASTNNLGLVMAAYWGG